MIRPSLIVALFALAPACGFGTHYRIVANGLASSGSFGSKFLIRPWGVGVGAGTLEFQEYAGHVKRALEHRGFSQVSDLAHADFVVFLSYSAWEQSDTVATAGKGEARAATTSSDAKKRISLGAFSADSVRTNPATGNFNELWRLSLTCGNDEVGLQKAFPRMLAAALELIGTRTEGAVRLDIWDSDPRVEVVTGKPNPNPITGYYQER